MTSTKRNKNIFNENPDSPLKEGFFPLQILEQRYGYAKDYIGWLARTGRVQAVRYGKYGQWYVSEVSLKNYRNSLTSAALAKQSIKANRAVLFSSSFSKDKGSYSAKPVSTEMSRISPVLIPPGLKRVNAIPRKLLLIVGGILLLLAYVHPFLNDNVPKMARVTFGEQTYADASDWFRNTVRMFTESRDNQTYILVRQYRDSREGGIGTGGTRVIREIAVGPSGLALIKLEERLDNAVSLVEATQTSLFDLSNDLNLFQNQFPPGYRIGAVYSMPSSPNVSGTLGGITYFGSKEISTEKLSVSDQLTLSKITDSTQCLRVSAEGVISGSGSDCGSSVGGVSLDSLDFDEFIDSMTLDADLTVASAGYSTTWNSDFFIGYNASVSGNFEVGGFASISNTFFVDTGTDGRVGIGTTAPIRTLDINGITRISGGGLLVGDVVPANPANPPEGEIRLLDDDIDVRFVIGEGTSSGESAGMQWNSAGNYLSIYHSSVGTGSIVLDSSGRVGIGTTSPTTTLDISGNASVSANFEVSGTASISRLFAGGGLAIVDTTSVAFPGLGGPTTGNVVIGQGAGALMSIADVDNVLIGMNAGTSITGTGTDNTCIGDLACDSLTSGDLNVVIGAGADVGGTVGNAVMIGSGATTIQHAGVAVGKGTVGGAYSVAVGYTANSAVSRSIAIGAGSKTWVAYGVAIGDTAETADGVSVGHHAGDAQGVADVDNVLIGYEAGTAISGTGTDNTCIGDLACDSLTSGDQNVLFGADVATALTTGIGNIIIGYQAGALETGSNTLWIENSNVASSSALIYGEFDNDLLVINGFTKFVSASEGNVIRLDDGTETCDLDPDAGGVVETCSSDESLKMNIKDAPSYLDYFEGFRIREYDIKESGEKKIGVIAQELQTTHPELVKNMTVENKSYGFNTVIEDIYGLNASGSYVVIGSESKKVWGVTAVEDVEILGVETPNTWVLVKAIQELNTIIALQQLQIDNTSSDVRLKKAIQDTHYGLTDLMNIKVRDFVMISDSKQQIKSGFIAQELNAIYPEAVAVPNDPDDYWMVDYGRITPLLVKSIQGVAEQTASLSLTVDELHAMIASQSQLTTDSGDIFDLNILFNSIVKKFSEMMNIVFENGLLKVTQVIADKLTAKEVIVEKLCVGQTCVTENELKALLDQNGITNYGSGITEPTPTPPQGDEATAGQATPIPTPSPTETATPEPSSTPETEPIVDEPIQDSPASSPEPEPDSTSSPQATPQPDEVLEGPEPTPTPEPELTPTPSPAVSGSPAPSPSTTPEPIVESTIPIEDITAN